MMTQRNILFKLCGFQTVVYLSVFNREQWAPLDQTANTVFQDRRYEYNYQDAIFYLVISMSTPKMLLFI